MGPFEPWKPVAATIAPPAAPEQPSTLIAATPSVVPLPVELPASRDRGFVPDSTGRWESVTAGANTNPALIVQVNQAGTGLSIWFTRPPPGVEAVDRLALKDSSGQSRDWSYGAGTAFSHDKQGKPLLTSSGGADFSWVASTGTDRFNPWDPSAISDQSGRPAQDGFEGNGKLRTSSDGRTLEVSFAPSGDHMITLHRTFLGARWPRRLIEQIPEPLRTQSLIDHSRPIPHSLMRQLLGLFAPEYNDWQEPALASQLRAWRHQSGVGRIGPRNAIASALRFGLDEPWRTRMIDLLRVHAIHNVLEIDAVKKPYAHWLADVLQDERDNGGGGPTSVANQNSLGQIVGGNISFAYLLNFSEYGYKRPTAGLGLAAYFFNIQVQKFRLTFMQQPNGDLVYDPDGKPVEKSRQEVPIDTSAPLIGVFSRMDAGVAYKWGPGGIKLNKSASGIPDPEKTLKDKLGTGDIGSAEFKTPLDLSSTQAFQNGWFTIASAVAGKAKFGNWVSANLVDSSYWTLHLPAHEPMEAIVDRDHLRGPRINNWGSVGSAKWWKDWKPEAIDLEIGRLSLGAGWILPLSALPSTDPQLQIRATRSAMSLTASAPVLFDYDAWKLDTDSPWLSSTPRMRLELTVSELRGVLVSPGGPIRLYGMTSPEGDSGRNLTLSLNRDLAVLQGIRDALGPTLQRDFADPVPFGEELSVLAGERVRPEGISFVGGGLHDPEDRKVFPSRDAFLASAVGKREKPQWPSWRRVDVVVEGELATTLMTADAPASNQGNSP